MATKRHHPDQPGLFEAVAGAELGVPLNRQTLLVPFGKFKDQPADLLLAHSEYAL